MVPAKRERSSRRSSILKLPKARQPLQNVESSESSVENSPAKLRRRVSFAEKKHVKEFCDSVEQGTVWDNTYEESDMSATKNTPSPNNTASATVQPVKSTKTPENYCQDQAVALDISPQTLTADDSIFLSIFDSNTTQKHHLVRQNAVENDFQAIEIACSSLESSKVTQVMLLTDPVLLANKENIPGGLEELARVESSLIEDEVITVSQKIFENSAFSVYCDEEMDKTNVENVSMDCTLPATDSILSLNIDNVVGGSTENDRDFEEPQEQIQDFQNNSMEITEAVPSSYAKLRQSGTNLVLGRGEDLNLQNKSMEMTEAVPSSGFYLLSNQKTQVFHDKSMEMTEAVPSSRFYSIPSQKTQVFHNKSMEMTEAVPPSRLLTLPSQLPDEKTQFFHDKSMEMTKAAPPSGFYSIPSQKTQVFHDKSMEMTEAISSTRFPILPGRFGEERTEVFPDKSMEMTEAVPPSRFDSIPSQKTQVFHNKSMEMTEAVPPSRLLTLPSQLPQEKTQFFHDKSMEMTEAISSTRFPILPGRFGEERTQVFPDKSMEMTEAVPPSRFDSILSQKTQVFRNKSMELTEAVLPSRLSTLPSQFSQEKTQVFLDKSMETTIGVPPSAFARNPGQFNDSKTQFFHNKSMEMTEAIPPSRALPPDTTQHFHNRFMDLTEAIPPSSSQEKFENQTEYYHNYFMELTESIPSLKRTYQSTSSCNNASKSPSPPPARREVSTKDLEELHRILHEGLEENKSLVPSPKPSNCINESMEMTTAIPGHFRLPIEQNQQGFPAFCQRNHSEEDSGSEEMEMTEVIPSFQGLNEFVNDTKDSPRHSEASDSFKENKSPPDYHPKPHEVHRELFKPITPSISVEESMETLIRGTVNNETSYDFTAPIVIHKNLKDLQDTEEPSFIHEDIEIPSETSSTEYLGLFCPQDDDRVSIPEISITEDVENRRRTHVIRRNDEQIVEKSRISQTYVITETIRRTSIELDGEIQVQEVDKNLRVDLETNFGEDSPRRRTFVVKRGYTEGLERVSEVTTAQDKVSEELDVTEVETNDEMHPKITNIHLELTEAAKDVIEKHIREENVEKKKVMSAAGLENDLIFKKLEQDGKLLHAQAEEKRIRELHKTENQTELTDKEDLIDQSPVNKSPWEVLEDYINSCSKLEDCDWKILKLTSERICIEYVVNAMVLAIIFDEANVYNEVESINRIRLVPRLNDLEKPILKMTDYLITTKINVEELKKIHKTYDHVPQLIQYVTDEINLVFDFYDELKKLSYVNKMDISVDKISFSVWTKSMDIILRISVNIKPFGEIRPDDVDVDCTLGNVSVSDVKDLIKNVKRDHKFLTFYMNDVRDYIELMEETTSVRKS